MRRTDRKTLASAELIVIVPGFNAHSGYYGWAAEHLVKEGASDKTLTLYEGYVHDLLNDVGKERVVDDITSWIGERVSR